MPASELQELANSRAPEPQLPSSPPKAAVGKPELYSHPDRLNPTYSPPHASIITSSDT
jgi:hypothetical protein